MGLVRRSDRHSSFSGLRNSHHDQMTKSGKPGCSLRVYQKLSRQTGAQLMSQCDDMPEKNRGEAFKPKPEEEKRLKNAIDDLKTWIWTLRQVTEDPMCLDTDVVEVVKDLTQQWKRGKLPNILPVMDFIFWSLLQWDGQKGSIAKHWNRNEELFNSRAVTQHIPESAWKWIIKGTVEVRLDPSTANPCLKISPDKRAVKMDQIVESVSNPFRDFRRTHHSWWCVLGSQGFLSGRHYWEVDVRGKTEWRIVVVREFASRNGFKSLNTTMGYWTLILKLGQLMALTWPVTKLDRCAPNVLGVSLDMEEGQVSFYDVCHRLHIYSFNVSFDQETKIFPVFGTIETKREMRILK
ncbi:hypothetical protein CRUP_037752 [Coryphaenoides rupestris]|nr:hypothetical protein CRUP_037752 [Coryphaenoides rupestris]